MSKEPSYGPWGQHAFCQCGRHLEKPSFGEIWFTRQTFPVCPSCGGAAYGYEIKTARPAQIGWFGKRWWDFKADSSEAQSTAMEPKR